MHIGISLMSHDTEAETPLDVISWILIQVDATLRGDKVGMLTHTYPHKQTFEDD